MDNVLPANIHPRCSCGASLSVPLMRYATETFTRTCRRCRRRWRLLVEPLPIRRPGVAVHQVTLFPLEARR